MRIAIVDDLAAERTLMKRTAGTAAWAAGRTG